METSVFISQQRIQILTGDDTGKTVHVHSLRSVRLRDGVIAGGRIADPGSLAASLSDCLAGCRHGAALVIDGDEIVTQLMDVPLLSERKLRLLVRNELKAQSGAQGELLCDYSVLEPRLPSGGGRILVSAVERGAVEDYVRLFRVAGVRLRGIDLGLGCVIRACGRMPELAGRTYILALLEEQTIVSLLFDKGVYRFSNRARLMEQRGTTAAAVEISRSLSSMVQFHTAQKDGTPIESAYICGLRGDEQTSCGDMASLLSIGVGPLPPSSVIVTRGDLPSDACADALYCVGGLMRG